MSTLLAMTTSEAEFAIEYSVSTRASSCRKDREPGAGEGSSAGLEGRGASGDGAEAWRDEGIVTAWLGWMFCAIEYGGGGYWGKNPGMSMACWKPFAGVGGEGAGVEGGPQKPRLPLQ